MISVYRFASFLAVFACVFQQALAQATQQKPSAQQIYKNIVPSVVRIDVECANGDQASGTGFFFRDRITVATCYHVIEGAKKIIVSSSQQKRWEVKTVAYDKKSDLALLGIVSAGSAPLSRAPYSDILVGDNVYVIGDPLGLEGLENSLSTGIVSGKRSLEKTPVLQFTAPISHGNSGGPVLNSNGKVIAIVDAFINDGQNINLGISADILKQLAALPATNAATFEAANLDDFATKAANGEAHPNGVRKLSDLKEDDMEVIRDLNAWYGECHLSWMRWRTQFYMQVKAYGSRSGDAIGDGWEAFEASLKSPEKTAFFKAMAEHGFDLAPADRISKELDTIGFGVVRAQEDLSSYLQFHVTPKDKLNRALNEMERMNKGLRTFMGLTDGVDKKFSWQLLDGLPGPVLGDYVAGNILGADPDPDLAESACIGFCASRSLFQTGDEVIGIAPVGQDSFETVKDWGDFALYTLKHKFDRYRIRFTRGNKTLTVDTLGR